MTFDEFKRIVVPLAVQLGAEWDQPTWKLYHRSVENIPMPLFVSAIDTAGQTRTKFPSAAQVREIAEAQRQLLIKANPYDGCCECEDRKGWREIEIDGVKRMERCPCSRRYIAKLAGLGVTTEPLALPPGREAEWSQVSE